MCKVKHEEGNGIIKIRAHHHTQSLMTRLILVMLLTSSFFMWCKSLDFGNALDCERALRGVKVNTTLREHEEWASCFVSIPHHG